MSAPDRELLASVAAKQAVMRLIEVLTAEHTPSGMFVNIENCIIDTASQLVTFNYNYITNIFGDDFPEERDVH